VWDNGTYTLADEDLSDKLESKVKANLQKGYLSFILNGKKLKGEFVLVKLKTKQENTWLLIKSKDQYAIDEDVLQQDKSVLSDMTLEDLENKPKKNNIIL
jgi:bifunctional non-homologous end joining protein LigD